MAKDNTNKHFKGQQRNEQLVYFTRRHWIVLLRLKVELLVTAGIIAGMIYLTFFANGATREFLRDFSWGLLIAIGFITVWGHYLSIKLLNYFLNTVIVTNFRIIKLEKTLYLRNDRDVVDLHEIQDIKKIQRGLLPNILNYGKLIVIVPTMIEPMILPYIPNPEKFFRKVNNSKRDYIHHRQQQRLKAITGRNESVGEPALAGEQV